MLATMQTIMSLANANVSRAHHTKDSMLGTMPIIPSLQDGDAYYVIITPNQRVSPNVAIQEYGTSFLAARGIKSFTVSRIRYFGCPIWQFPSSPN